MEQYTVTGMSCAACSARVEKAVKAVPGVTSCSVSLLTNSMGEEVHEAYKTLVAKCRAKGLGVLGPVVPPTQENLKQAIADGYNMIILGNDMWHFQKALKELVNDQVAPVRKELLGE